MMRLIEVRSALAEVFQKRCKLNKAISSILSNHVVSQYMYGPCSHCGMPVEMCSDYAYLDYYTQGVDKDGRGQGNLMLSGWYKIMWENANNVAHYYCGSSWTDLLMCSSIARHMTFFSYAGEQKDMHEDHFTDRQMRDLTLDQQIKGVFCLKQEPTKMYVACSEACARKRFENFHYVMKIRQIEEAKKLKKQKRNRKRRHKQQRK